MLFELNQYKSLNSDVEILKNKPNNTITATVNSKTPQEQTPQKEQNKNERQKRKINIQNQNNTNTNSNVVVKQVENKKKENLDKLFLKFHDIHITKTSSSNSKITQFQQEEIKTKLEETKLKIEYFEKLKKVSGLKELLKKLKLKLTDIETNFINEEKINVKTLSLLIITFLLPRVFIIQYKKCIYIHISSSVSLLFDNIVLNVRCNDVSYNGIAENNDDFTIMTDIPIEDLEKYTQQQTQQNNNDFFVVDDIHFKLKSMTSYKLPELLNIHNILFTQNDVKQDTPNQKKTKQDIYNEIIDYMNM